MTGRQNIAGGATHDFVQRYFPGAFDNIYFTNSHTSFEVNKIDACRSVGADVLIDDLPWGSEGFAPDRGRGDGTPIRTPECILFGDYGWNSAYQDKVLWAKSWSSIE